MNIFEQADSHNEIIDAVRERTPMICTHFYKFLKSLRIIVVG